MGKRSGAPSGFSPASDRSFRNLRLRFNYRSQMSQLTVTHPSALNAKTFEAWLEHHLLPTLEEGDIVVLDNLNVHKSPRVAEIVGEKELHGPISAALPAPTSTQSRRPIRSSNPSCENSLSAPSPALSPSSKVAPISSNPANAKTTLRPADMTQPERIPL